MSSTWLHHKSWHILLDPRKAFQRFIELHRATRGSLLVNSDVGLRWSIGQIGLEVTPTEPSGPSAAPSGGGVILQLTYVGEPNPLQLRGMEAIGHLAWESELFPDLGIIWTLNDARAQEFRAFVARSVNANELREGMVKPTSKPSKRMRATQKSLESKGLANYCPLNCDLCGLTGFRGSFHMAEHLRSRLHKEQVSLLKRALRMQQEREGWEGFWDREELLELQTWQIRNRQLWPRADGALFEVFHSDLLDEASQDHAPDFVEV